MKNKEVEEVEVSKVSHYKSFCLVAKEIKDPMARLAFYEALDDFRFFGIEPENLPHEANLAFIAIRAFIEADVARKKGGAPKGNANARKKATAPKEVEQKPVAQSTTEANAYEALAPQTKEVAKEVFNIFSENGLPCCNGNLVKFTLRDFRLSEKEIEELQIERQDLIKACRNYVEVIKLKRQGKSWWKSEQDLSSFCNRNVISRFLPDSFRLENFKIEKAKNTDWLKGKILL